MGGGGETKTKNEPPKWFNDAAIKSLEVADQINQAGYVPYQGNEIAAFNPQQNMAMQSAADWMGAANGQRPINATSSMPQPKMGVDNSGVLGYGSYEGLMSNLQAMQQRSPDQYKQLTKFGGDMLARPGQIPGNITDSPWQVGAAAKGTPAPTTTPTGGGNDWPAGAGMGGSHDDNFMGYNPWQSRRTPNLQGGK